MRALIIVDMLNDFVDGKLANPKAQAIIVSPGDMHAVDPRQPGPRGERGLDALMKSTRPWSDELLGRGEREGARVKSAFAEAFSK